MSNATISKNAIANISGMFIQIMIAFILSPFLVHTLGDIKYGIWTIAVAFTGYMNLLDLGISSAVNKYVSQFSSIKDDKNVSSIVSTSLALFFIMGLIIVLISPFMADFIVRIINIDQSLKKLVNLLIIIVSFDIAIFVIGGLFKGIFGGLQKYTIINLVQIISAVYKALMFYVFLSHGHDLITMGYISISANLFAMVVYYWTIKKKYPHIEFSISGISKHKMGLIINYSKFTFLAMFANQIIYYSDAFVIGYFISAAAVTYYSIPWTLAEYSKKILMAISKTYIPAISEKEAKGDLNGIKLIYISGTKYMLIISNLLSIGMIVFGGVFISVWMGPNYRDLSEAVLVILFINLYFQGPQQISYSVLLGTSQQKLFSYISVLVSVVNLILSIILVQKFGIIGAAMGAAIPQIIFYGLFVPWITLKVINIPKWYYIRKTHLKGFIPTIVLFVVLEYFLHYHTPGSYFEILSFAIICTLIYCIFVYLLMLDTTEKNHISSFFSRLLSAKK